jgi:lipoprotein-anchoring transpeptidase ErfK/SrfK
VAATAGASVPTSPSVSPTVTRPTPPDACARNQATQRVIVDVSAQHAWMCARARTVYQTAVTTGAVDLAYDSTPLGTFHVQSRNRDTTLALADGRTYAVRYWIPFDAPLYGFHDASWQTLPFGSAKFRTQGSHGCVHLPMAAMAYLYHWVSIGAAVTVRA